MSWSKLSKHQDNKSIRIEIEKIFEIIAYTLNSVPSLSIWQRAAAYHMNSDVCPLPVRGTSIKIPPHSAGGTEAGREVFFLCPWIGSWNSSKQAAHQAAAWEWLPPANDFSILDSNEMVYCAKPKLSGNVGGMLAFWGHFVSLSAHSCSKIMFSYLQLCYIN